MKPEKTPFIDVLSELDSKIHSPDTVSMQTEELIATPIEEVQEEPFIIMDDSHLFFEQESVHEETGVLLEEVQEVSQETPAQILKEHTPVNEIKQELPKKKKKNSVFSTIIFLAKYLSTSALIFAVLLFTTNYSAYSNIAMSFIFQKDFQEKSQSLLNSVQASSKLSKETTEDSHISLESATLPKEEKFNSIETLASQAKRAEVDLWITITPYENRIIIPKIGKNIPLIDIKQETVEGIDELNNIFMEELENGVVRYPGSAKPGQDGNTFIFGHSSNFPWMEWDYNDVFSLLDKVTFDDEVIVYYEQKKYTYKIRTKEVIRPGDVSVLKRDKGKSEITLMTCWPIGTTLNRMILIGELVDVK